MNECVIAEQVDAIKLLLLCQDWASEADGQRQPFLFLGYSFLLPFVKSHPELLLST